MTAPVTRAQIEAAAERIRGRVRRTPVLEVSPELTLKLELLQHTGSFKPRGAFNRVLSAVADGTLGDAGVVAASGGNAGLAVAHVAHELGLPARVFVPTTAPEPKVRRLRELGAAVELTGSEYAEAYEAAVHAADETGAPLVHAYDQPEIVAGQGTIGLDLLEQAGGFDTVLVAVGGGGLIGGIATAIGDRARVVGVEPELCPTMHAALAAGGPVDVAVSGVAADSLGARRLGDLAYAAVTSYKVSSLLVGEDAIVAARRELWQRFRLVTEHGAATAYAALATGAYKPEPGERVVVVVCGANTDPSDLG
ncbi:MAG TPA: threonine/serine dehydratase [Kribbellaceae bacterium]|nr:threonine/serine dehydratase [Kribbellaceae bacterium]